MKLKDFLFENSFSEREGREKWYLKKLYAHMFQNCKYTHISHMWYDHIDVAKPATGHGQGEVIIK